MTCFASSCGSGGLEHPAPKALESPAGSGILVITTNHVKSWAASCGLRLLARPVLSMLAERLGVPQELLSDQMKAVITRGCRVARSCAISSFSALHILEAPRRACRPYRADQGLSRASG